MLVITFLWLFFAWGVIDAASTATRPPSRQRTVGQSHAHLHKRNGALAQQHLPHVVEGQNHALHKVVVRFHVHHPMDAKIGQQEQKRSAASRIVNSIRGACNQKKTRGNDSRESVRKHAVAHMHDDVVFGVDGRHEHDADRDPVNHAEKELQRGRVFQHLRAHEVSDRPDETQSQKTKTQQSDAPDCRLTK